MATFKNGILVDNAQFLDANSGALNILPNSSRVYLVGTYTGLGQNITVKLPNINTLVRFQSFYIENRQATPAKILDFNNNELFELTVFKSVRITIDANDQWFATTTQGETGIQGIQGVTGIQGFQGDTGALGATGFGVQGDTGIQGIQGSTGVQGPHGNQEGGSLHSLATTGVAGFLSPTDKLKLDNLDSTLSDLDGRLDILEGFGYDQIVYVSKNGVDTNSGKQHSPFLTITAALNSITDATSSKRYVIKVAAGSYTESSIALKANVFVVGCGQKESVRITGAVSLHSSFSGGADNGSGISQAMILSACDFNWNTVTSAAGKLYFNEVSFSSTINLYGHNNATAQAQFNDCVVFGAMTISGINVGVYTNCFNFADITLTQHPNGGMPSVLSMAGGYCSGTVSLITTVNDFNRRCGLFARSFWMNALTINGASSYADVTYSSLPAVGPTILNGGNIVYLNPSATGANDTLSNLAFPTAVNQPIIPATTNATNFGDWGKQWMWNFGYVHASTGTDCYLISYPSSYTPDTEGKNIGIYPDGAGLASNANGGNIELETAAVSGTGIRGEIVLNARRVDVKSTKVVNLANGTDTTDAINKGQLDTKITKGTKTIFCIDNGEFANAQAAIDAASADDVIVFGAKAGGWGDVVIPAGKRLSLKGLMAERSKLVVFGSITFSPSSGSNANDNELYVDSIFFNKSSGAVATFGGTNLGRLRFSNCLFYAGETAKIAELTNTASSGGVNSSVYFEECVLISDASSVCIETSTPYVRIYRSSVDGGSMSLKINAGLVESNDTQYNCSSVNEVVSVAVADAQFICANSLITNATTNGSGVSVVTNAVFSSHANIFSIATGTGYCVRGSGVHLYGTLMINNTALQAGNVKIQNTLTSLPYTTAFTSAP